MNGCLSRIIFGLFGLKIKIFFPETDVWDVSNRPYIAGYILEMEMSRNCDIQIPTGNETQKMHQSSISNRAPAKIFEKPRS